MNNDVIAGIFIGIGGLLVLLICILLFYSLVKSAVKDAIAEIEKNEIESEREDKTE